MQSTMVSLDIGWNNLRRVLQDYGWYFITVARNYLDRNGTNASGTLSDSMDWDVEIDDDRMSVGVWIEDYWYYVENGRKAGKWPPPPKIEEWILIKPIQPYADKRGRIPSIKQLTYLIGRKIAENGTDPQPFFQKAVNDTKKKFEPLIAEAIEQDISDYLDKVLELTKVFL